MNESVNVGVIGRALRSLIAHDPMPGLASPEREALMAAIRAAMQSPYALQSVGLAAVGAILDAQASTMQAERTLLIARDGGAKPC
jgi:hypothetical protein